MQELYGTYRGITPIDRSGINLGEVEIVIDAENITTYFATGQTIDVDGYLMSDVSPMQDGVLFAIFNQESQIPGICGITLGVSGVHILLVPNGDYDFILVSGLVGEENFGPSELMRCTDANKEQFEKSLQAVERTYEPPRLVARLSDGRVPSSEQAEL